ncbi:MAG TPA: nucleotidyltransferase family protein [Candidatus Binataceae bacterium]|nr:nucleotidyltransferase family protein [Candidatus Binataceae bacterium]
MTAVPSDRPPRPTRWVAEDGDGGAAVEAILLAAGESRRMGYPKPLLRIGPHTFVEVLARAILPSVNRLIVVIGAHREAVRAAIPPDPRIAVVDNPDYRRGQLSSIKAALPQIGREAAAAMIHLADHPMVRPETFRAVVDEFRHGGKPIVIARHRGRRGHPVLFARDLFAELAAAPEEQGARAVVAGDPARVAYVDVDDAGVLADLDTPEDLARAGLSTAGRRDSR